MFTESQLLTALSSGDEAAFTQLYDSNWLKLHRYAKSILNSEDDAEDVCADVFAKVWEKRQTVEKMEGINKYLYEMVKNKSLDLLRTTKRRASRHLKLVLSPQTEDGHDKRVEILNLYTEVVLNKIDLLPSSCQEIIRLHYIDGLSHDEIAKKLKLAKSTIHNHRYNGLRILKQMSSVQGATAIAGTLMFVITHFGSFLKVF